MSQYRWNVLDRWTRPRIRPLISPLTRTQGRYVARDAKTVREEIYALLFLINRRVTYAFKALHKKYKFLSRSYLETNSFSFFYIVPSVYVISRKKCSIYLTMGCRTNDRCDWLFAVRDARCVTSREAILRKFAGVSSPQIRRKLYWMRWWHGGCVCGLVKISNAQFAPTDEVNHEINDLLQIDRWSTYCRMKFALRRESEKKKKTLAHIDKARGKIA